MSSALAVFNHSIGRKLVMGLSGLFLVSFLFVHVGGNSLLFLPDDGVTFNKFVRFMTTNPVIKVLEWVLFAGFLIHFIYAGILTMQNRQARPGGYVFKKGEAVGSTWMSRNMGLTGVIVLLFFAVHVAGFWGRFHFTHGERTTLQTAYLEGWKVKEVQMVKDDLGRPVIEPGQYLTEDSYYALKAAGVTEVTGLSMYRMVQSAFSNIGVVIFYVIAMILLALHLSHGFQSAFRTVGLVHSKYTPAIKSLGFFIAVVIPVVFAAMPLFFFFKSI
jgi:succinate dehydrogenase / fumarate reductase cytochrome b subunit